jgi:hypothetical protein
MVAAMSLALDRLAALFALAYVGLFVGLIAFTTNGPDPTLQPADEMARAVSEGSAMRASALLGFAGSIALAGFATCLALMLLRGGDARGAAFMAVAGVLVAAIDAVSAAALITAVEAADRDLGAGVFAAFGDLHTAALLFELPAVGFVVLLAWRVHLGRIVSWLGAVVGLGCVLAVAAVMSRDFDQGPFGFAVMIWFIGLPIWLVVTSIVLLRRRDQIASSVASDVASPA